MCTPMLACIAFIYSAPSAKVQDLTAYAVNSTTILINWKQVDCIHRNSRIVQYLVSYDASITLREQVSVKTSFTVTGLVPRSNYTFTVSAVGEINGGDNTAGTSDSVEEQTPKSTGIYIYIYTSILYRLKQVFTNNMQTMYSTYSLYFWKYIIIIILSPCISDSHACKCSQTLFHHSLQYRAFVATESEYHFQQQYYHIQ